MEGVARQLAEDMRREAAKVEQDLRPLATASTCTFGFNNSLPIQARSGGIQSGSTDRNEASSSSRGSSWDNESSALREGHHHEKGCDQNRCDYDRWSSAIHDHKEHSGDCEYHNRN